MPHFVHPASHIQIPAPQLRDDIELDGSHYFLSKQHGEWAILHDGIWAALDSGYVFTYAGEDSSHIGKSKWRLIRKPGTPKLKSGKETSGVDYAVTLKVNKHVDTVHVKGRDERQVRMLALSEISKRHGVSISTLRNQALPDAFHIKRDLDLD